MDFRREGHPQRGIHCRDELGDPLGLGKVRYHGLAKNTARVYTSFALANLYLPRRRLLPAGVECAL